MYIFGFPVSRFRKKAEEKEDAEAEERNKVSVWNNSGRQIRDSRQRAVFSPEKMTAGKVTYLRRPDSSIHQNVEPAATKKQ